MKNLAIIGTVFALTSAAQAMPIATCISNTQNDPRQIATTFTVQSGVTGQAFVTVQTNGGMRHFITAPRVVQVSSQRRGPEAVEYFNTQEDFELTIVFQPIGGHIYGTFTGALQGQRVQMPLTCVGPQLWTR
jgi:hypothetical protein